MKEKLIIKNKSTPVMKQYWEAKKSYPDSLMLFRMGDFYETFEEDAILTSKILGITLTKRANGAASSVPLAGFPYHSLDKHVHKLLNAGYKIALCEQVEDPKFSKGIVKRSVVEVLTPGTAVLSKYIDNFENNFLISLFFDKEKFAYSIIDNSTGEFYTSNALTVDLKQVLSKYNIKEILVSKAQEKIVDSLISEEILLTAYDDWKAKKINCYEKLINHFGTKSLKSFGIEKEELCIISSGTCLYYLEGNFPGKFKHINSISLIKEEGYMRLDPSTIKNLELFNSNNYKGKLGSLINVIDKTVTTQGSRLIKNNLRKPLNNKSRITRRFNQLHDLFNNKNLNVRIKTELKRLHDMQRIVSRISNNKASPVDILNLANSLAVVSKLQSIINNKNPSIATLLNKCKNTSKISNYIKNTIKKNPSLNISKGGFIKDEVSKKLDDFRSISLNANNWLVNYQLQEKKKNDISSLKIKYNKIFGYYIEITNTHLNKIPENYIRKQTLVNSERFYTPELKNYEEKILNAENNIIEIEKNIFKKVNQYLLNNIKKIQFNSIILAKIDVLCSHASLALENNYVRPIFTNKINLELEESRHPVIEKILPLGDEFISNKIVMNQKNRQIGIVTGPNMAGKSTFLRQIAHIIILAQIGSYVPASHCRFGLVDQLFTRVGANDNIAEGESTFLVEMIEAAYILNNATKNSFIILDEIGRGTSTFDGLSLAWAITEFIHNNKKNKALTLFATHYHELIFLADKLESAFNLNIEVKEHNDEIIFLRKIKDGGASKSYGIQVAEMAGLPYEIISRAKVLLDKFMKDKVERKNRRKKQLNDNQLDLFQKDRDLFKELKKIDTNALTPLEALNKLNSLKKKYNA